MAILDLGAGRRRSHRPEVITNALAPPDLNLLSKSASAAAVWLIYTQQSLSRHPAHELLGPEVQITPQHFPVLMASYERHLGDVEECLSISYFTPSVGTISI